MSHYDRSLLLWRQTVSQTKYIKIDFTAYEIKVERVDSRDGNDYFDIRRARSRFVDYSIILKIMIGFWQHYLFLSTCLYVTCDGHLITVQVNTKFKSCRLQFE